MNAPNVVIVGGGLAGVRTAQSLREIGHAGQIRVLSEEAEAPYDRPPLSKDFLLGRRTDESIRLLDTGGYLEQRIELLLNTRAIGLDFRSRTLALADGTELGYERLVVATGAQARRLRALPGSGRVHYLRTADDSRRLGQALVENARVVVVGAGFIGLEVASSARQRGCHVTVVEAAERPLEGVIGSEPSAWLQAWHTGQGIGFHCGTLVEHATDTADGLRLLLSDGSEVTADSVVVGVGVARDTGWLGGAGLEVHHGLVSDDIGRTSAPGVFGVGDIVCRHSEGECLPVGHWTAASDSATRVAQTLMGVPSPLVPEDGFFWSEQAGLRLQFVGRAPSGAVSTVEAGSLDEGKFVVHYTLDGRLTGVFAANSPRDFLRSRMTLRTNEQCERTA